MCNFFGKKMMLVVVAGLGLMGIEAGLNARNNRDVQRARMQGDKAAIKRYIVEEVAGNIAMAQSSFLPKKAACAFGKISGFVYDSMPLEFFKNITVVKRFFEAEFGTAEALQWVQEGIKKFEDLGLPVTDEAIGRSLYCRLIDKITVSDADRQILHEKPIKLDEFVRHGKVKRDEYMKYTLLNLIVKYYLEKTRW